MGRFSRIPSRFALAVMGTLAAGVAVIVPAVASAATTPAPVTGVTSVSCPSKAVCFANALTGSAHVILSTSNGGSLWSEHRIPFGLAILDCPTTSFCVGGGIKDEVLVTANGGQTWTATTVSSAILQVQTIDCLSAMQCWLTGLSNKLPYDSVLVYHSANGGKSWLHVGTPGLTVAMNSVSGISCVNSSDCLVTGNGVLRTTNGGKSWSRTALPHLVLDNVACTSAEDCIAVSNITSAVPTVASASLYSTSNDGSSWIHRSSPTRVDVLNGLTCATPKRCVSVGTGYTRTAKGYLFWAATEISSNGGATWTQHADSAVGGRWSVSSARGTTVCVAVGSTGNKGNILRSTNYGFTWKAEMLP